MFMTLTTDSMEHSNYHDPQIPPELQTKKLQEPPRISHRTHQESHPSPKCRQNQYVFLPGAVTPNDTRLHIVVSKQPTRVPHWKRRLVLRYHRSCRRALRFFGIPRTKVLLQHRRQLFLVTSARVEEERKKHTNLTGRSPCALRKPRPPSSVTYSCSWCGLLPEPKGTLGRQQPCRPHFEFREVNPGGQ